MCCVRTLFSPRLLSLAAGECEGVGELIAHLCKEIEDQQGWNQIRYNPIFFSRISKPDTDHAEYVRYWYLCHIHIRNGYGTNIKCSDSDMDYPRRVLTLSRRTDIRKISITFSSLFIVEWFLISWLSVSIFSGLISSLVIFICHLFDQFFTSCSIFKRKLCMLVILSKCSVSHTPFQPLTFCFPPMVFTLLSSIEIKAGCNIFSVLFSRLSSLMMV